MTRKPTKKELSALAKKAEKEALMAHLKEHNPENYNKILLLEKQQAEIYAELEILSAEKALENEAKKALENEAK